MKLKHSARLAGQSLFGALVLSCASCATKHSTSDGDQLSSDSYTMAGYEFSTRSGDDNRPRILERFGPPLAAEQAGSPPDYHVLTYPVAGESDRLLILFHRDELLGVFRESGRATLDSTIQSHQRSMSGRPVLFQSHFGTEKSVFFIATQEQLNDVPKWSPGDAAPPPLSKAEAEGIVSKWHEANAPHLLGRARVLQLLKLRSVPGIAFYQVSMGDNRSPAERRHALVLMDGSLILGEFDP